MPNSQQQVILFMSSADFKPFQIKNSVNVVKFYSITHLQQLNVDI